MHYKRKELSCHIDPDLSLDRRKESIENWRPIFGQINFSASYLLNSVKIDIGDIFLFLGNFHHVKMVNGKYKYVSRTNDFYMDKDLQLIWGYLQVAKIVTDAVEQRKYTWHPHSNEERINGKNNVMFVARETLSFNENMPGAGILNYNIERVLTAPNANKATWIKNNAYDVNSIIGTRKNLSKIPDGIYYAGIWQELGLQENAECELWAKKIIEI